MAFNTDGLEDELNTVPDSAIPIPMERSMVDLQYEQYKTSLESIDRANEVLSELDENHPNYEEESKRLGAQISNLESGIPQQFLTGWMCDKHDRVGLHQTLKKKITPAKPILKNFIHERQSLFIYAPSGAGKSFVGMALSMLAASSFKECGEVNNYFGGTRTLYMDAEIDEEEGQRRLKMLIGSMELEIDNADYEYFNIIDRGMTDINLTNEFYQQLILRYVKKHEIKMVVIDNLRSMAYGDDENTASSISTFNKFLDQLHGIGAAAIVIHHSNKEVSNGWSNYSGTTNFVRPYSGVVGLKVIHEWEEHEPYLELEFCFDKRRSNKLTLKRGFIKICDETGLSITRKETDAVDTSFIMPDNRLKMYHILDGPDLDFFNSNRATSATKADAFKAIKDLLTAKEQNTTNPTQLINRLLPKLKDDYNRHNEGLTSHDPTPKTVTN